MFGLVPRPCSDSVAPALGNCAKALVTPHGVRQIPGYVSEALVASYKTNRGKMFCFCFHVIGFIL